LIEVHGLTKRYGRTVAVDDLHFSVRKGEILGFLGPNGAGKTTTMRVLTGFLPPTLGKVTVAGYDVMQEPLEVKRRTGYLPETPPLYTDMRVDEMLAFAGRIKGVPRRDLKQRIEQTAEKTAISDVRSKIVGHLSKGYRQRVGLAVALIHNPDVLVLDEPTAGLDPKQIIQVLEAGAMRSALISLKGPRILRRDFSAQFPLKLMHKDLGLILATAAREGVSLPVTALIKELYQVACSRNQGDLDYSAIITILEELNGVTVAEHD